MSENPATNTESLPSPAIPGAPAGEAAEPSAHVSELSVEELEDQIRQAKELHRELSQRLESTARD